MDPKYQAPCPAEIAAQVIEDSTKIKQKQNEEAYLKSIEEILKQLREMEWHDLSKTMKSQIRQWFFECRWDWKIDILMMTIVFADVEKYYKQN